MNATVLIVDDEPSIRRALVRLLSPVYRTMEAGTAGEAVAACAQNGVDVVLLDLHLPDRSGLEALQDLRIRQEPPEVVMMTGQASVAEAVEAMKRGAHDFLTKPFVDVELVALATQKALEKRRLLSRTRRLEQELDQRYQVSNLVGSSPKMQKIFRMVKSLASNDSSVLILGESGTGKEVVARTLHHLSRRHAGPFIPVDLGVLPETVVESELFGHVRGAFTGANTTTRGLFREADKGTLFLDEIGEASLSIQSKLLRVIEEREVRGVGETQAHSVDVRIVAATNRDLEQAVREESFRRDLYYRLNVVTLILPPLRERAEDIPLLVQHFIQEFRKEGRAVEGIHPDALMMLRDYAWPGNIRELRNCIERAFALGTGTMIMPGDLPEQIRRPAVQPAASTEPAKLSLAAYERLALERALRESAFQAESAARLLGISKSTFYRKLQEHGIRPKNRNS